MASVFANMSSSDGSFIDVYNLLGVIRIFMALGAKELCAGRITYLLTYLRTYLLTYLLHGAESFLRS